MCKNIFFSLLLLIFLSVGFEGCLITNCPRGGKRSESYRLMDDKGCITCGPGHSGRCLGAHICCGPFGCLMGTLETIRCKQQMLFQDVDACELQGLSCKKNTGKCVGDGLCCTHDACYIDKECENAESSKHSSDGIQKMNLYNLLAKYQAQMDINEQ